LCDRAGTRNIKLILEYDGTAYAGWQIQPGLPTIQGALAGALKEQTGTEHRITGASRTDAGVHAIAQAANFVTSSAIPARGLMAGLNSMLPPDIAVRDAGEAAPGFDARKDALGKTYIYRVFNGGYRTALDRERSWSVFHPLDVGLMREGAGLLIGKKDFSSFRATGCASRHPVREILSFTVEGRAEGFIEFEVRGTAFLRHMVRIMVGTLVTLGRGGITIDEVSAVMEARDRTRAPLTAPPQGLFLKEVEYAEAGD